MIEQWKPILDWEDLYEASTWGRIRSIKRKGLVRKQGTSSRGYPDIQLSRNGKKKDFNVQVLIALTFVGPHPEGYEVNHKDGNKCNNVPDNLEWITHKENVYHAFANGMRQTGFTDENVAEIRKRFKQGERVCDLLNEYPVSRASMYHVLNRTTYKHVTP